VTTVEERRDLGPWREQWDGLVARQALPSPFQRSWWLETVSLPGTRFALVLDDDRLVGGAALGWRGRAPGRLVAPGPAVLCPDHLDALAEPGAEELVIAALRGWFVRSATFVDVRGIVPGGLLEQVTGVAATTVDQAPYQSLDGAYLAGRSASFRRNVRRGGRRLDDLGLAHERVAAEDLTTALARFWALHAQREDRGALLGEARRLDAAVLAGAARDEVRIDVVGPVDRAVAVSIGFLVAGRLSLYQVARSTAREHGSAGTVLLASVIEDAAASGCREVDLLRGEEDYKSSFADRSRPIGRLRAARGAAVARLRAEDAARRVSARLRSRAGSGA
jgi:CelD/BcsL family acetyltransferase involved in cellulose biosynthesis